MERRTSYVIATAIVGVLGIALAAGGDHVVGGVAPAHHAMLHVASAPASLDPVLEIGIEHAYGVSLATSVRSDTAGDPEMTVSLDGTWAIAYAGQDARGLVFRAQLRDAKPTARRNGADVSAAFTAGLARPFYFSTTEDGRLRALYFAADVDGVARSTLGAITATLQRTSGTTQTWEASETDGIGDYRARYVRAGRTIDRDRVAYDRVAGGHAIAATIVTTGTVFTVRDDGWSDDITGAESTRVGTKDVGVVVATKFRFHHTGTVKIDAGWPTDFKAVAIDDAATSARANEEADRELVDGATLPDLLAAFAQIDPNDHQARGYAFLRMAALLRLDPHAADAATRSVLDGTAGPNTQVLVGALGQAGTPQAQAGLGHVMSAATLPADTRTHAAIALGLTAQPTDATLAALAEEAARPDGDVSASATLAEGTAALHLRGPDGDATVDALLTRFTNAADDEERALVLRALGNTGDPRILPAVQQGLASADPIVRIAATEALRLVPGDTVDALVLASLRDPSSLVRAAAVFAATPRPLAPFVVYFMSALRTDGDVTVRRAVVELAGARITELPELRALVAYAADHDPDPELRETAKSLLATPDSAS